MKTLYTVGIKKGTKCPLLCRTHIYMCRYFHVISHFWTLEKCRKRETASLTQFLIINSLSDWWDKRENLGFRRGLVCNKWARFFQGKKKTPIWATRPFHVMVPWADRQALWDLSIHQCRRKGTSLSHASQPVSHTLCVSVSCALFVPFRFSNFAVVSNK